MQKHTEYDWKDSNVALIGTAEDRSLKKDSALQEPAWQQVLKCTSPRLFIWRINKFKVESVPESDYGRFFNGDSYIVLHVYKVEENLEYDVHFWIGKNSTQDEYGTAAYKTVELDNLLDDKPIQHREVEGYESELFKSYFKVFESLSGGYESGFRHVKPEEYQPRLMHFCQKGQRVEIREVCFSRRSLDSGDVYILDLGREAFQWNGQSCNPKEKMAAAQFLRSLASQRNGRLHTDVIDENDASSNTPFLQKLPDVPVSAKTEHGGSFQKRIYKISDSSGKMEFTCVCENSAPGSAINEEDVYFIMSKEQLFVYVGSNCSPEERKNALIYGGNLLNNSDSPFLPVTVVNASTVKKTGMDKCLD